MDYQVIGQLIGSVGFPIAVSLILLQTVLTKFNKQMEGLEQRIDKLNTSIDSLVETIHHDPSSIKKVGSK
ncbi:YvrJ family protein [Paenibacillus provencensis]|uniref:YvrJ family protein n=1 Tax=Paenibacillus provencensis TaxID=441151 RepID=A0ABW3PS73_9BACL|nr:YvrJ family protein [Paenibacillus sp. MER 78]MCM3128875.1 YvrJ family protein [Paenibacillus sp. MER 78]